MTTPAWSPGVLYPPGSLVVPSSSLPPVPTPITNPGFETGTATGWTLGTGVTVSNVHAFTGTYGIRFSGTAGVSETIHDKVPVNPGKTITAKCMYEQWLATNGKNTAAVQLYWYNGASVIRRDGGSLITDGGWSQSVVTGTAPPNATHVAIGIYSNRDDSNFSYADSFEWDYIEQTFPPSLTYRAVQAAVGLSGASEPTWPTTLGVQVVDNQVTWEAVLGSRVVWEAHPIMRSGATEPTWSTAFGSYTSDNNQIKWETAGRNVTDPKAPKSKIVVTDQGKVYAGDDDLIAFSAVNNPLDWSTPNNAGYLPFGQGKYGGTPVSALGLYRGNLAAFNGQGFQLWQIDPDPALNQRLDQLPFGSLYHRAFSPVANDSFFLASLGVRTVGIAASSTNIAAGDVGLPIDPLVQPALALAKAQGVEPIGMYSPSSGQYWLMMRNTANNTTQVFVYTITSVGSVGAWSRYIFPFQITMTAMDNDTLLLRAGDQIIEVDASVTVDRYLGTLNSGTIFTSWFQTAWLEMGGKLGQDKQVEGFDLISDIDPIHAANVQFGWDERDENAFTPMHAVPYDTSPDYMIPEELTAPSISVRVTYNGGKWRFYAMNVYLQLRRLAR